MWRIIFYLWPLPNSLLGLAIGILPFLGKRSFQLRRGTLAIYGPAMNRLLSKAPIPGGAAAITFGHVILAADEASFESTFEHEWIHVKQYIWWGPFFIPAYLLNSGWHWLRGDRCYSANAFEKQAVECSEFKNERTRM